MMTASPKRGLLVPSLFTLLSLALLIYLGNWQTDRLAWKESLVAQVEARTTKPPVALPPMAEWANISPDDYEYTPVRLQGRFLHDRTQYVYIALTEPKGRYGGPGYWVMTPVVLPEGGTVLVNRGFVPLDRKDPATRPETRTDDGVTVEGLMRRPEPAGLFTPDDDPAKDIAFARDPKRLGVGLDLPDLAPFTIDAFAGPPGTLPQGSETRLSFPNRHREYALTWYGLAVGLMLVYFGLLWSRWRKS